MGSIDHQSYEFLGGVWILREPLILNSWDILVSKKVTTPPGYRPPLRQCVRSPTMNPESPYFYPLVKVACSGCVSKRCVGSQPLMDVVPTREVSHENFRIPSRTNQDFPWKTSHFDHDFFHEHLQNSQQGHPVVVSGFLLTTGVPG